MRNNRLRFAHGMRLFQWPLIVAAVFLGALGACGLQSKDAERFIVLPGAYDLVRDSRGMTIRYRLKDAFPATEAIENLKSQLVRLGWTPQTRVAELKGPYGNPEEMGWSEEKAKGDERIMLWVGSWQDRAGNVISYDLYYRRFDRSQGATASALEVDAIIVPSSKRE